MAVYLKQLLKAVGCLWGPTVHTTTRGYPQRKKNPSSYCIGQETWYSIACECLVTVITPWYLVSYQCCRLQWNDYSLVLSIWGKHFPMFLPFLTPLILCYHIASFCTFQELLDRVKSKVSFSLVQRFNFNGKKWFFNWSEICQLDTIPS